MPHAVGIQRELFRQDFDRDVTFQFCVACAIDLAHPAFTKYRGDFVRAELSANRDRHKDDHEL